MKKILILLYSFLWISSVFSADTYEIIDKRLDEIEEKIVSQNNSQEEIIMTLSKLIQKTQNYEKKYSKHKEIFNYISQDLRVFLNEYKQSVWYINVFIPIEKSWEISGLTVFQREFSYQENSYFILRKFYQNNMEKYLVLQDKSYKIFVLSASDIQDISAYGELYENSEYKKHQDMIYNHKPNINSSLQNNGITHLEWWEEVFLTADFCPSWKNGFEKEILEKFIKQGHKNIWIAITSTWIEGHSDDYTWLRDKNNSWELNILWINHTKTHNYEYGVDFSKNFILTPWLKLRDEILDVEKKLLEKWQIPSIFLRYPGLVSDNETRKKTIYDYGLLPLWANAWLAKWEHPQAWSIILIHGNKNEHYGVELMKKILDENNFQYWDIKNILK